MGGKTSKNCEPHSKKQKLDHTTEFDCGNKDEGFKDNKNNSSTSPEYVRNSVNNQNEIQYLDSPLKSQDDFKEYRTLKLPNGLSVLLVSDSKQHLSKEEIESLDYSKYAENKLENAKSEEKIGNEYMALASLCINVGSFSDPSHVQGLAHLLEHTITMGSKKYPKENDYSSFIEQRWGSSNAYTDYENTLYSFRIPEKYLFETLDRFSNCFIDPLLSKDAISRECHSIENEFKLMQQSDDVRRYQLIFSLKKQDHPASIFSCGNKITLQRNINLDKLHSELHEFRKQHYSAHRMTLLIQASLSLDILEDFTKQCFSAIPVNYLPPINFSQYIGMDCFDSLKFKRMYYVKTIEDILQIELNWVMPPMCHLYKIKPWFYISDFLYRTEEGSLFYYLKKKHWAAHTENEEAFFFASTYSICTLRLTLTNEGYTHLYEVLKTIFSYINFMQLQFTDQFIFQKFFQYTNVYNSFSTYIRDPSVDDMENIVLNMQYYPSTYYLNGYDLVFEYDPKTVKNFINILKSDNVNIVISSKQIGDNVECNKEFVYQTEYSSREIPKEWIESWKMTEPLPEFHIKSEKAEAIVNNSSNAQPKDETFDLLKIDNDKNIEVWYKKNSAKDSSKFSISFYFDNPSLHESSVRNVTINIIVHMFEIEFKKQSFEISTFAFTVKGFLIEILEANRTHSYDQLAQKLIDSIFCDKLVTEELFELAKSELLRRYYNYFIDPKKLARDAWLALTWSQYWMVHERYNALIDMSYSQFLDSIKNMPTQFSVKCIVEGNMEDEEIIDCVYQIVKPLLINSAGNENHAVKILKYMNGEKCCQIKNINLSDAVTVVNNIYQTDVVSVKILVSSKLLTTIINEPLFHCLRTQEQLGYHVEFSHSYLQGVIFLEVTVFTQADKFNGEYINGRIQNFINNFTDTLKNMSKEEFSLVKENYVKCPKKLDVPDSEMLLFKTDSAGESFDSICEKEMETLETITLDEVHTFFIDYMVGGAGYKKISLQIVGTSDSSNIDENVNTFKLGKYLLEYSTEIQENEKLNSDYYIDDVNVYKSHLSTY